MEMPKDDWLQLASAINRLFPGDPVPSKRGPVRSRRRDPGVNTGKPWTRELDLDLSNRWGEGSETWKHGPAFKELAEHFGRSSSGIMSRLMKLGLLDPRIGAAANAPTSPPADK